jgi:predicted nuclease of predicted toxin-antitoxin system
MTRIVFTIKACLDGQILPYGKRVSDEGRFFITLDLDFADIRRYKPGSHPGILLLRTRSRSSAAVLQVLERVLNERRLESLAGCLAVADESLTRVRASTKRGRHLTSAQSSTYLSDHQP